MGLDLASVQLLCCAKSLGVDFSETLMIGRQTIFCDIDALSATLSAIGIDCQDAQLRRREFGEPIFALLGARQVASLDASDYQQATHICDLNLPGPNDLSKKFSLVYDGGSLEHVFNLPQALKTCMEMVKVGGSFVQLTVANNYMGHGFWQLSPEAIYRVFSPENGYAIKAVFLHEVEKDGAWYQVADPATVRSRVELVNDRRTYMCTIARRVADKPVFAAYPCQSDYAELWTRPHAAAQGQRGPRGSLVRRMIPRSIKAAIRFGLGAMGKKPSSFSRPCYRYISADDLVHGRIEQFRPVAPMPAPVSPGLQLG